MSKVLRLVSRLASKKSTIKPNILSFQRAGAHAHEHHDHSHSHEHHEEYVVFDGPGGKGPGKFQLFRWFAFIMGGPALYILWCYNLYVGPKKRAALAQYEQEKASN